MSITSEISPDQRTMTIRVSGKFNFSLHKEFNEAYENISPSTKFVIDLGETKFMDSSSLGMLLQLKRYVGDNGNRISIRNCNPDLKRIFEISKFDRFFDFT